MTATKAVKTIGRKRQLFIDRVMIERTEGIALQVNPPEKKGTVVRQDRPWRSKLTGYYGTVLEDGGLYKMWTNCGEGDVGGESSFGINYGKNRYMQLLISTDGLHWESPSLGLVEFRGSRRNNLVTVHDNMEGTVFLDPQAPPGERYKYLRYICHDGLFLSSSPDGIHWGERGEPLLYHMFDSQNVALWDDRIGKYVCYLRGWESPRIDPCTGAKLSSAARNVVRVELDDFRELKRLQADVPASDGKPPKLFDRLPGVIRCDERDPEETDVYTNAVAKYPLADDVYLAFPALYSKFKPTAEHANDGVLGVQLAVSRDGADWHRYRTPYIRTGPRGEAGSASTYMYTGMLVRETEILMYYWGSTYTHGGFDTFAPWPGANVNEVIAVSQRIDGFVSADADYGGGMLLTKPFTFDGSRLIVNIATSPVGSAAVAVVDADGRELDGFAAGDCDRIKGNWIDKTVSWTGSEDVGPLQGRTVRLRFTMRDAKLYSFRFE